MGFFGNRGFFSRSKSALSGVILSLKRQIFSPGDRPNISVPDLRVKPVYQGQLAYGTADGEFVLQRIFHRQLAPPGYGEKSIGERRIATDKWVIMPTDFCSELGVRAQELGLAGYVPNLFGSAGRPGEFGKTPGLVSWILEEEVQMIFSSLREARQFLASALYARADIKLKIYQDPSLTIQRREAKSSLADPSQGWQDTSYRLERLSPVSGSRRRPYQLCSSEQERSKLKLGTSACCFRTQREALDFLRLSWNQLHR